MKFRWTRGLFPVVFITLLAACSEGESNRDTEPADTAAETESTQPPLGCAGTGPINSDCSSDTVPDDTTPTGGTPLWRYEDCEDAIGSACTDTLLTAFAKWGENIPLLYVDEDAGWEGAYLGEFADEKYPAENLNALVLYACADIEAPSADEDGEEGWFSAQFKFYTNLDASASHELFDAAMEYICPDLGWVRAYDYDGWIPEQ